MTLTRFRVHFDMTSLAGVTTQTREVLAASPSEAEAMVRNLFKPKPIDVHKVKKLREGMDA
ncbi:MAG: hypothetical protein WC829_02245 [Hyphomicrobium sp.]|jgi:hypothetical protein